MISDPELGVLVLSVSLLSRPWVGCWPIKEVPCETLGRRFPGKDGRVPFGRDRWRGLCSIVLYFTGDEAWGVGSAREVMVLDCWP